MIIKKCLHTLIIKTIWNVFIFIFKFMVKQIKKTFLNVFIYKFLTGRIVVGLK